MDKLIQKTNIYIYTYTHIYIYTLIYIMDNTHTVEYHSAMRKKGILSFATTWIDFVPGGLVVKNSPANVGDIRGTCSIPGSGR